MEPKNYNNEKDVIEIDLLEVFLLMWHNIVLILSVGLLCATAAFAITKFLVAPYYESTTKIYILNKNETNAVTYSDTQLATQLTKDYSELITSRYVMEQVIQEQGLNVDYDELCEKVKITTPTDTRIVEITVEDKDPVAAMNICNSIRETASDHIQNVMDIDAVNVVETANMPDEKAGPSSVKAALIAGLIGCFIVCVIVFIRYMLDDTIKSPEDIEKYLGLSTLGIIPIDVEDDSEDTEGGSGRKGKKKSKKG